MQDFIRQTLRENAAVNEKINQRHIPRIIKIARVIIKAYRQKKKVVLFGNGGSAADAQHLAAEFVCRFKKNRRALEAVALTVNTSILTAVGNDYEFKDIFSRQVEAIVKKGDVVIGISTSGNSPNVLEGIKKAKQLGAITVGFSGQVGKLAHSVDIALAVPSDNTPRIQEMHITVGHIICEIVENELFK
ncbi:MAG: D-sedoheptulose 7-phosphate isomerase [bacterium]